MRSRIRTSLALAALGALLTLPVCAPEPVVLPAGGAAVGDDAVRSLAVLPMDPTDGLHPGEADKLMQQLIGLLTQHSRLEHAVGPVTPPRVDLEDWDEPQTRVAAARLLHVDAVMRCGIADVQQNAGASAWEKASTRALVRCTAWRGHDGTLLWESEAGAVVSTEHVVHHAAPPVFDAAMQALERMAPTLATLGL